MNRPTLDDLKIGVPKRPMWKDPGLWATAIIGGFLIFGLFTFMLLLDEHSNSYKKESGIFEDVAEARAFQRECLKKPEAHARVSEGVTGIVITCHWRSQ